MANLSGSPRPLRQAPGSPRYSSRRRAETNVITHASQLNRIPVGNAGRVHPANNFDFLRLAAATAVLVSHQFALGGQPEPLWLAFSWGGLGVLVFFAISGFLVAGSWHHDPHAGRFAARRLLRVWPGLAVACLLVALVLGPLVSPLAASDYFRHPETRHFLRILGLWSFDARLPGVFPGNPVAGSANGSLWTIPVEIRCYLALAALGLVGLMARRALFLAAYLAFAVWFFFLLKMGYDNPLRLQLQMGVVFFTAVALFQLREFWQPRPLVAAVAGAVLVPAAWMAGWQELAFTLGLPLAAVLAGSVSTPLVRHAGRWGDVSYGVYIYAYPVQQTVVWLTANQLPPVQALALTLPLTLLLAGLSWHLVEKPALRWKDRLR